MKRGFVGETHVVVYCDGCGDLYADTDGESICFDTTHQAAEYLAIGRDGWLYDGDRITCDGCLLTVECDQNGHDYTPDPGLTGWPNAPQLRRCERCGAPEDEDGQENPT